MIASDQPTFFPDGVIIGVSSRDDGTVLDRTRDDRHDPEIVATREAICDQVGVRYEDCVYQIINYGDNKTYDIIREVTRPDVNGVHADVLYTETPGVGLFLPVADCVATVIYDTQRKALALAHLGRHASIAHTMTKTIEYLRQKGSDPSNLIIWMAPHVAADDYRMEYFDSIYDPDWRDFVRQTLGGIYLDLAGFNAHLAQNRGVPSNNIHISRANTARNPRYFSHTQGDTSGRFAVLAMLRVRPYSN